jgi:hypothetical protein
MKITENNMPVNVGNDNGGCFARWGEEGKKYYYECGNDKQEGIAKEKAYKQGIAIGEYEKLQRIVVLAVKKTSFEFDGILSTRAGQDLWRRTGGEKWVITARSGNIENMVGVWEITDALRIPRSKVIATGSNRLKIEKIKELGIDRHYDDNGDVITRLPNIGRQI